MSKSDRRAAADADKLNIAMNPVRGSFIGLLSYSRVNTPPANHVTIPRQDPVYKPKTPIFSLSI